ncbi:MAG: hypothetical protein L3K17_01720 [Thermoplasmata archaeon]|nr:hypothetical protein [Thermoplasmata archaeon]
MRPSSRTLGQLALVAVVALTLAAPFLPTLHATSALPAPRVVTPAHGGSAEVKPTAQMPAATSHPSATGSCPTPTGTPIWNSPSFFSDALVNFYVPGDPALNNSNFQTEPCPTNVIPTYLNGFWMYVTSNVALQNANVTIWGTSWSTPGNFQPDVPNFAPATPRVMPMYLEPPYYHTAAFYFNIYEFFWPGSQIYFNITLQTIQASPGTIRSTESTHNVPVPFSGGVNNATWGFYVADPWGAGNFAETDENFSQDIAVSTTPSVLTTPAFQPNPKQTLQITLTSINPSGGKVTPIPMAEGTFTLTGPGNGGVYYQYFGPTNHTTMQLVLPLGPYPGTRVQFNITAWLPWEQSTNGQVGAIDRIYSQIYSFNWSSQGGWWAPTQGVSGNLQLSITPNVNATGVGKTTTYLTDTPVNVTIHSPIENVTISSAAIQFRYSDANGFTTGAITMSAITKNTSSAILPGLAPGGTVVFSVTAKDVFGNPVSSGNYSYTETGPVNPTVLPVPAGYGLFFVEALDLSSGQLVSNVNYSISNSTWSEHGRGSLFGFAAPVPIGGVGYLPVSWGGFTVTLTAFGNTETYTFTVASATPFTVVFYFASQPITPNTSVSLGTSLTLPAVAGLVGAAVVSLPVVGWFRERRRKAEAEQRRVTL